RRATCRPPRPSSMPSAPTCSALPNTCATPNGGTAEEKRPAPRCLPSLCSPAPLIAPSWRRARCSGGGSPSRSRRWTLDAHQPFAFLPQPPGDFHIAGGRMGLRRLAVGVITAGPAFHLRRRGEVDIGQRALFRGFQ